MEQPKCMHKRHQAEHYLEQFLFKVLTKDLCCIYLQKLGRVFIMQHSETEDGSWTSMLHCTVVPLAIVLGSTMGILFLICVVVFIAILVSATRFGKFLPLWPILIVFGNLVLGKI